MDLWTKWQWQVVDRFKVEVAGRGWSLRKVDETFPKGQGKRHKLQKKKGRPIPIGDLLEIMKVVGIDPRVFFAQLARGRRSSRQEGPEVDETATANPRCRRDPS